MTRRPSRPLTVEERLLWEAVVRATRPLAGRPLPARLAKPAPELVPIVPDESAVLPGKGPAPGKVSAPGKGPRHVPVPAAKAPDSPPILLPAATAGLERRRSRALARGRERPDGVIDLHGMTQFQAHAALARFLRAAQSSGHTLVLVVTGKGRPDKAPEPGGERGVLRRVVPHWLALPDLRGIVVGFEEAATRQGGGGALYVRLRRAR